MLRHTLSAALAAACLLGAAGAQAQSLSLRGGTTGLGAELGYGLSPMFGLRANYYGGSIDYDETDAGILYEGKLKLGNGSVLLDLHPFSGSFRLTGGIVFNSNKIEATARGVGGTIEINGVNYPASDVGSLRAAITWDKTSPYLGLGWGTRPQAAGGLFATLDLGAILGKPKASLSGTCGAAVPVFACTQLQNDIRAEERQLQNDASDVKIYPVLSFGLGYRF